VMSADEFMDLFPVVVRTMEEPVATASALPFYRLCQLARNHVKVVLTGQGADEPFAGYARHMGERYSVRYRRLPRTVRGAIAQLANWLPRNEQLKRAVRSLAIDDPTDRMLAIYGIIDPLVKRRLCRDGVLGDPRFESIRSWRHDVQHLDPLSQMLYVDARTSLADNLLMYGDKMSMASSLEVRVPFLDLELMAFAESLSPRLKIRGIAQKYILKQAMTRWVLASELRRPKIGFVTPVDQWFRGELTERLTDTLLSSGSACVTYFRPEVLRQLLDEHRKGRCDHKRVLFSLLTFETWHQQFLNPRAGANSSQRNGSSCESVRAGGQSGTISN
jgi:asparagine synthase (glutamine-hydrolysing)